MTGRNVFYAQSGGVTSVINASAAGVLDGISAHPETFGQVFAGKNGIFGSTERRTNLMSHNSAHANALGSCTPQPALLAVAGSN
jgi:hypothetical protein